MSSKEIRPKILRVLIEEAGEDDRVSSANTEKGYISERFIADVIHREFDMGYKKSAYQPMVNVDIQEMSGKKFSYDGDEYMIETQTERGPGPNDRNIARALRVKQE